MTCRIETPLPLSILRESRATRPLSSELNLKQASQCYERDISLKSNLTVTF
jgi:hypothetical protein